MFDSIPRPLHRVVGNLREVFSIAVFCTRENVLKDGCHAPQLLCKELSRIGIYVDSEKLLCRALDMAPTSRFYSDFTKIAPKLFTERDGSHNMGIANR